LANEIERGDWIVVPALPADVLASPERDLWGNVLRRQGMPLALLATHPGDVKQN
jgi:putative transcriptional regulator